MVEVLLTLKEIVIENHTGDTEENSEQLLNASVNQFSALLDVGHSFNPLPTIVTNIIFHKPIRIYMGSLILGVNTLYMLFCF